MQKPILCIGRSYGSGGREIGEKLAQRLAVPCYDKLLIEKATHASGIDAEVLSENDERLPSFMLSGNSFADTASMMRSFYSETQQVNDAVHETILRLAGQGPCVFVGRCASAVLKGANTLSVFVYADPADCVARVMERNHIGEKEAQQRIRKINRMRRQYYDFYSETLWGQPESYDLMISSSKYGIDGCVETILQSVSSWEAMKRHE